MEVLQVVCNFNKKNKVKEEVFHGQPLQPIISRRILIIDANKEEHS